jgi:hypothetical protein
MAAALYGDEQLSPADLAADENVRGFAACAIAQDGMNQIERRADQIAVEEAGGTLANPAWLELCRRRVAEVTGAAAASPAAASTSTATTAHAGPAATRHHVSPVPPRPAGDHPARAARPSDDVIPPQSAGLLGADADQQAQPYVVVHARAFRRRQQGLRLVQREALGRAPRPTGRACTRAATLRPTRSLAWAWRMARSSEVRVRLPADHVEAVTGL